MKNTEVELPENMTRVLVEDISGVIEFAYYKDGMFKADTGSDWVGAKSIKSWMPISKLKSKLGL